MAMAAIKISDKGSVSPFFFRVAESTAALCHNFSFISIYDSPERAFSTTSFSSADLTPCRSSNITMPQVQTGVAVSNASSCAPVSDTGLKNSIQTLVSANILFFKIFQPLFLGLHLQFFFFLPIIINLNFAPQRQQFLELFIPDKLFHRYNNGPGLGLFAGEFCTSAMRLSGMFNVARILYTSLICFYCMQMEALCQESLLMTGDSAPPEAGKLPLPQGEEWAKAWIFRLWLSLLRKERQL